MNLREQFEKWYRTQNKVFQDTFNKAEKGERDRYYYDRVESGWQGFQSGHAAGLEQAEGHSANTVGGPTPVMDAAPAWEMMAIAWLRGKAAGQAQNNERWPDHAKCYPRWTLYVDIAQELANELEREHQKREDTRNAGESDS